MGKEICVNAPTTLLDKTKVGLVCRQLPSQGRRVGAPADAMSCCCCHAGALDGSGCPFRTALSVLSKPGLQFILATTVALAAGLLAWYYV